MPEDVRFSPEEISKILQKARQVYGNKNQILVCIEELNELACVLAKYPRYDSESRAVLELCDKALDEVADVYIILEHVKAIFNMSEDDVAQRKTVKAMRVKKWLSHSDSMQETIDDRVLEESPCKDCTRDRQHSDVYNDYCAHCLKAQATEGLPIYKKTD